MNGIKIVVEFDIVGVILEGGIVVCSVCVGIEFMFKVESCF